MFWCSGVSVFLVLVHADMMRFLLNECLRQAFERNIVSLESSLLKSFTIVVYVGKNVVAFKEPIFASCTSVPQKDGVAF